MPTLESIGSEILVKLQEWNGEMRVADLHRAFSGGESPSDQLKALITEGVSQLKQAKKIILLGDYIRFPHETPRQHMLAVIRQLGAQQCAYVSAEHPEVWPMPCDCKPVGHGARMQSSMGEHNGCFELHSLYRMISKMSDRAYMGWRSR